MTRVGDVLGRDEYGREIVVAEVEDAADFVERRLSSQVWPTKGGSSLSQVVSRMGESSGREREQITRARHRMRETKPRAPWAQPGDPQ